MLKRLASWVRGVFAGGNVVEDNTNEAPETTMATGETLNPEKLVDRYDVLADIPRLARGFELDNPDETFSGIAEIVATAERDYQGTAQEVLAEARQKIALDDVVNEARADVAKAGETAKADVTVAAFKRAERLFAARERLDVARKNERSLKIGITGNPEGEIVMPDVAIDVLVTIAAFAAMLALEFFVNFSLVRFATDSATSAGFSFGLAVVAALSAHLAARSSKRRAGYADAVRECKRYFARWKGVDPETGLPAHVFPPDGILPRLSILAHSVFIGACVTVIGIRTAIVVHEDRSIGDLAGSLAFVLLVAGYYVFKLHAGSKYPSDEMRQYFETRKEIEELARERAGLGNIADAPEVKLSTAMYNEVVVHARKRVANSFAVARTAREHLARLIDEASGARNWFTRLFEEGVDQLVPQIIMQRTSRYPGLAQHRSLKEGDGRAEEVMAIFARTRPVDLDLSNYVPPELPIAEIEGDLDITAIATTAWAEAVAAQEARVKSDAEAKKVDVIVPSPFFRRRRS